MALESATYISDLVSTNPTSSDNLSQGDDHLRLIKASLKATFPSVTGAVTADHTELNKLDGLTATTTELNYVAGVTSAIQSQLNFKAPLANPTFTGVPAGPTAAVDTNTTQLATTAYVVGQGYAKLASPALTGTPTAPTAAAGTNTTQLATTAYVVGQGYLTSASASATYLTSATAAATYATQATVSGIVSATSANVLNATAGATTGAVGTYAYCRIQPLTAVTAGNTISGSTLYYSNASADIWTAVGGGTWRAMGQASTAAGANSTTLFLRIA